jgi:hypothetical protein
MIQKWFSLRTAPRVCAEIMLSFNGSDGSSIKTRLASIRCMGGCGVLKCGRRPIQKARDQFPGAGSIVAMMSICR